MKPTKTLVRLLVLCLAATWLGSALAQDMPSKDTLVVAQSVDATTLDPAAINSRTEANIAQHIFATLLQITPEGKIEPYLAKDYTWAPDGKSITFHLNDGVKCEDGEPLQASDVAYSFNRAADPKNAFTGNTPGFIFDAIGFEKATADGPLTVTIHMKSFNPIDPGLIAEVYVTCAKPYQQMSLQQAAEHPVGSGPYKMVKWVKDDRIVLERVPGYTLKPANFKYIVWRVIPEATTRSAELIAGNVDIVSNVSPDQAQAIDNSGAAKVVSVAGTRRIYIGVNFKKKFADASTGGAALQNQLVRQALNYAIDVPTICKSLLNTTCTRPASLVNPPNNDPNIQGYPYDPKKAEQLLDQAGYPRGKDGVRFTLTLQAPKGRYLKDSEAAQAVGQYFDDIGVKTNVQILDWSSVYVPLLNQHDAGPLYFIGSGGGTWSALYDMADITSPTSGPNYGNWPNPEWFKLWDQVTANHDPQQRRQIINQMLELFHKDSPWIMLYFQPNYYGVSNRVNWTPRRDEEIWVNNATLKQ